MTEAGLGSGRAASLFITNLGLRRQDGLRVVKGWGGALVCERIVAAASRRLVILVGEEKLVRGVIEWRSGQGHGLVRQRVGLRESNAP